jgi:hypothetical protein
MSHLRVFMARQGLSAIAAWIRLGALTAVAAAQALAQFTFTTFDVPGAAGTHPYAINNNGDVAGWYDNGSGNPTFAGGRSGFIRKADGTFTLFDLSSVNGFVRQVTGITDLGQVAGSGESPTQFRAGCVVLVLSGIEMETCQHSIHPLTRTWWTLQTIHGSSHDMDRFRQNAVPFGGC